MRYLLKSLACEICPAPVAPNLLAADNAPAPDAIAEPNGKVAVMGLPAILPEILDTFPKIPSACPAPFEICYAIPGPCSLIILTAPDAFLNTSSPTSDAFLNILEAP